MAVTGAARGVSAIEIPRSRPAAQVISRELWQATAPGGTLSSEPRPGPLPRPSSAAASCEGTEHERQSRYRSRLRGAQAGLWRLAGPWWLMLITGIAWLVISVVVLRFRLTSITTVGVLIGVVFLVAMVNEFLLASVHAGWRWAHVLLGSSSWWARSGRSPTRSMPSGRWPR